MTSVARRQDQDSEYSDASHAENEHDNSGNDGGQPESDYDSAGSESDRSDRDPDNQETERRVDDDEDRSNPQYIPKRGTFYEHDDRTAASGEESNVSTSETASEKKEVETPAERRRAPRKSETVNKWSHDKYNENEQVPKSRDELVAIYGYDIRNEDAPPHARRNRRYGRGPNKYTRTWEDVDAYRRQANAPVAPRKPPNPEDFPELEASNRSSKKRIPRPRSKSQPSSLDSSDQGSQLRRNASVKVNKKPQPRQNVAIKSLPKREREVKKEVKKEFKEKMPQIENLTITTSTLNNSQSQPQRKVTTVAQQRPVPTEQGRKKPPPPQAQQPQQQNNATPNKSPPQQQPQPQQQKPQQQSQQTAEQRGSKRYSSLRQRPLDTYQQQTQQQTQQQHSRYHGEYPQGTQPAAQHQGSPAPQIHPQQMIQQMHRNAPVNQQQHGPSPPHQQLPQQQLPQQQLPQQQLQQQQLPQQQLPQQQMQQQQQQMSQQQLPQQHSQVRLGLLDQQSLVAAHHSMHNMQQHSMGQIPPGQAYAPPAMMPAQYMQQGGSGAVFGGAAMYAQPPAPYPHQLYQHHNFKHNAAVPPPVDANWMPAPAAPGVTYYSCAEQEPPAPPRATRRPTAAIPIVRPPLHPDRPANSSDKDNIDRIVENMFVRKPWPSTHGADASKEKSETRNSQEPQSKESSQPNSLTSSSISTDSKPSENIDKEKEPEVKERESIEKEKEQKEIEPVIQESISTDA